MKRKSYYLFFLFITFNCYAQENILKNVKSNKVKHFLKKENLTNKSQISGLCSVCADTNNINDYYKVKNAFIIKQPMKKVWQKYNDVSMDEAWDIKKAKFQFLFDPQKNQMQYYDQANGSLQEGQMYFFKLKLLGGIFKLVVISTLSQIDQENHCMEFCYVENGVTKGSQFLKFEAIDKNSTRITHETFYKSDSKFRDTKLYPSIHEKIIKQFHENIKSLI